MTPQNKIYYLKKKKKKIFKEIKTRRTINNEEYRKNLRKTFSK